MKILIVDPAGSGLDWAYRAETNAMIQKELNQYGGTQ